MPRLFCKLKTSDNGPVESGPVESGRVDDESDWSLNPQSGSLAETRASENVPPRPMKFSYSAGSTPLPRYTIRRGIGVGGFGEVYFAVTDAGKEVALKRIQRNLEVELRGVSHCLNLKHPNLVALYDVCPDDQDQWWVVMEYVAGPNLRQVLDDSPSGLPSAEVNRWFAAIASGVNHLHSAGLVHRDIKPGNIFDDLGTVKVGDYGLSKFISTSHRGGHTESVGTFHYMAPEIGRGQYGREIDIYAMGIVLYELLTGRVPFDGESCHEIIVKHMTALPDLTGIAEPYRETISKCLQKDPASRFSNVDQMLASLGLATSADSAVIVDALPVEEPPIMAMLAETPSQSSTHESFVAEEPLARAIRTSFSELNMWWRTLDRSPGAKALLMLVACFVMLVNTHWLLPLLSILGVGYVPYYIVRQMLLHVRQQPSYAEAQRLAVVSGASVRPMSRTQWREHMRSGLRAKHSIHRVAELNTSWIAAILATGAMTIVAGVIGLRSGPVTAMSIAPYGWMSIVVLMSTIGILGIGKLWEREDGEGLTRRLVLAGLGAGVGAMAYGMSQFLMLPLDHGLLRDVDSSTLPQALYDSRGVPMASAMMAHFAMLFACLRWWKPVDPLRRTRLSLWSIAVAVVAEWAVHQVLPIPQPSGMLVAGGIAIAVQMAAPWISPRQGKPTLDPNINIQARPANARSLA